MSNIRAIKGMNDLFEEELVWWRKITSTAEQIFKAYGYGEIRTPILEEAQLFIRGVGETTDIVEKEMYLFEDRDKKMVCLRPENTAGVVRAMLQHGKIRPDMEERVYYFGQMFRRERPQKGRYRQFHQLGVEAFGVAAPSADVETMAMLHSFLTELGMKGVNLVINSLGEGLERQKYTAALKAYFTTHQSELCQDCQRRLEKNVLRILDCKVETCKALGDDAPTAVGHLDDASRQHFEAVENGLQRLNIPYSVSHRLVRGLDYYTRTVFEAMAETGLGAQNTVIAGGRYDGLVSDFGGKPTPAVGFAGGIERLVLLLKEGEEALKAASPDLVLVGADDSGREKAAELAFFLRAQGIFVEVDHKLRSVKAQMRRANRMEARYTMVLGNSEIHKNRADLKNLEDGNVQEVALNAAEIIAGL